MEKNTRNNKRKAVQKQTSFRDTVKRVKETIELEGEEDFNPPEEILNNSIVMAEANAEALREVGRVMADTLNQQLATQRQMLQDREEATIQRLQDREEATIQRFERIIEGQNRNNLQGVEMLTGEFEKMRLERETARGITHQKLPNYDGVNMGIDDWIDRIEAVMVCNKWDIKNLLDAMPTCLTATAKRAYDSLVDDDKNTKESFFTAMRIKIDPTSAKKNKELFVLAKRLAAESVTSYIDRCRMYIRRSGGNPSEPFALDMLRLKVFESLSPTDSKILNATVGQDDNLTSLITKADSMLTTQTNMIAVVNQEIKPQNIIGEAPFHIREANGTIVNNVGPRENRNIVCHRCHREGHIRRFCKFGIDMDQGPQELPGQFNQNGGQFQANGRNYMPGNMGMNQPRGNGLYGNVNYMPNPAQPNMLLRPHQPMQPNIPYQPQRPAQPPQQHLQQNPGLPDNVRNQNRAPPVNAGNPANQAAAPPRAGNNMNQVPLN